MFLIKPKRGIADQLIKDRAFKGGLTLNPTLGAAAALTQDLDYVVHLCTKRVLLGAPCLVRR